MKKMYRLNVQSQQHQPPQQSPTHTSPTAITLATTPSHIIIQQHPTAGSSNPTHILGGIPAGGGNGPGGSNSNGNGGTLNLTNPTTGKTTITTASPINCKTSSSHMNGDGTVGATASKIIVASIKAEPMQDVITITPANTVTVVSNIVSSVGNSIGSSGSTIVTPVTAVAIGSNNSNSVGSNSNAGTTVPLNSSTNITTIASTSTGSTNGHNIVYVPNKRAKLDGHDEWISSPSPSAASSAAPLSPSPGSQSHNFNTNISNGYPSPMSTGSYDAYSPNGKMGREDLSPSSSLNGYGNDGCDAKKSKKGPTPRMQEELCLVCGDRASGYHYNALTCEGCKGFFRRSVTKNAVYCCKFGHACEMDMYMRRKCQECRLKKCLAVGMRPECVVPENQCAMKRKEKKAQKEKDKGGGISGGGNGTQIASAVSTTNTLKNEILQLMKCDPPHPGCVQLLPEKLLAENRVRNIPPLTSNQLHVIYKLIWYQDGYEQPSEEDLKRIMISSPDENESQHDISFRHITEITILTVQLIVEFAKGLPAFTKIPQEDQITLLKACSSEVMMLRMARRYDAASDSIYFANNRSYTRDSYRMAGMADNIEDLLHFCRRMYSMTVDNVEYALLTAIVIFSDRPGLEEAELVEAIQSYYIDTLRVYILNRHGGDAKCLVFFAKLLSILTELRTLGNQNAEMCFSLKLKNRKLPRFLEEIWDVHAIPPSVQSHLQANQQQQQQQQMAAAAAAAAQNGALGIIGSNSSNNSNSGMISDDGESSSSRGTTNMGNSYGGGTTNLTAA